jgi:hypothetical protein
MSKTVGLFVMFSLIELTEYRTLRRIWSKIDITVLLLSIDSYKEYRTLRKNLDYYLCWVEIFCLLCTKESIGL